MLDAEGYAHLTDFNVSKRFGAKAAQLKAERRARRAARLQKETTKKASDDKGNDSESNDGNVEEEEEDDDEEGEDDDEDDDNDDCHWMRGFAGSPAYCPPEMYKHERYTCKVDLWSLGITMYEMLMGQLPWTRRASKTVAAKLDDDGQFESDWFSKAKGDPKFCAMIKRIVLCDIKFSSRTVERLKVSESAQDLVMRLCCPADERLGVEEAMKHPFFEGVGWDAMLAKKLEAPFKPDTSVANADNSLVIQDQMGPKRAKSRPLTDNEQALFINWDWLSDALRGDHPLEELTCPDPALLNKRSMLRDSRETRERQRRYLERRAKTKSRSSSSAVAASSSSAAGTEDDDSSQHNDDDDDNKSNDNGDADDGELTTEDSSSAVRAKMSTSSPLREDEDSQDDIPQRTSSTRKKKKRRSVSTKGKKVKN
jgi:Protein kinase domain